MTTDFAPGIPAARAIERLPSSSSPQKWPLVVQEHQAKRAGKHFDLRLMHGASAHSWALRYWPAPGEVRLAVQQPTHRSSYSSFQGTIKDGYGAGTVRTARSETAEILSIDNDHVRFNLYPSNRVEEYLMKRTHGNQWIIKNVTPTRNQVPTDKPKYKSSTIDKIDVKDKKSVLQAKIDGAHVTINFGAPGSRPIVASYRTSKRDPSTVLDHTPKIPGFASWKTPKPLANSTFRGELYAVGRDGRALPASSVGGILNSNTWKAREKQRTDGSKLKLVAFDVEKLKNKPVANLPFSEKLKILDAARKESPWMQKPRTAATPAAKAKLIRDIMSGKERSTTEGVVEWRKDAPLPRKGKIREEKDVYVLDIFYETGVRKGLAGGFTYSLKPGGPAVGRVGTGFSHALKKDMAERPHLYKGLKARTTQTPAPGQALRAPAFVGWHLDQELPPSIKLS